MFHKKGYITSNELTLYPDSSSTVFGGFYKPANESFMDIWDNCPYPVTDRSMTYLEIFPILISCWIWGGQVKGRRVVFVSDNEGTVSVINKGRSKCPHINSVLRKTVVISTICNFTFIQFG